MNSIKPITGVWPEVKDYLDADGTDHIKAEDMLTLPQLFQSRVKQSPDKTAYTEYDTHKNEWVSKTWSEMGKDVQSWMQAFATEGLKPGDTVAIRHSNSIKWVLFDQAAMALGLVVVPLYAEDRPDNVAYMLGHAEVKLMFLESTDQWISMKEHYDDLPLLKRIVIEDVGESGSIEENDRVIMLDKWLKTGEDGSIEKVAIETGQLATIVYTSGTTGRPKGVMLSHKNIVSNVRSGLARIAVYPTDKCLSFLPLSHALERSIGYYLTMAAGAHVVYNRSVPELAEDLVIHKPTILISVPRIFERVYGKINAQLEAGSNLKKKLFNATVKTGWDRFQYQQGRGQWRAGFLLWPILDKLVASKVRNKMGGNMRFAISGGAPLPASVSKVFIGLGINIVQGYGLTESSPVISCSALESNYPASIGYPLTGIEVSIGDNKELLARGDNIMLGYLKNEEATAETITAEDGWLQTGDQAEVRDGALYIIGRIKEIIVLSNGEKVPPADMESAIAEDPLFEQIIVLGEQKPYLSAIVVLNEELREGIDVADTDALLARIAAKLKAFPGYAQVREMTIATEPWTVENGLITPTLKIKRNNIMDKYEQQIAEMYEGH